MMLFQQTLTGRNHRSGVQMHSVHRVHAASLWGITDGHTVSTHTPPHICKNQTHTDKCVLRSNSDMYTCTVHTNAHIDIHPTQNGGNKQSFSQKHSSVPLKKTCIAQYTDVLFEKTNRLLFAHFDLMVCQKFPT